jgi:hypothetical protein
MLDVGVRPPLRTNTRLATRTQAPVSDLAGEGLIRPVISRRQRLHLGEQHRRPQMRIVSQSLPDIGLNHIERIDVLL